MKKIIIFVLVVLNISLCSINASINYPDFKEIEFEYEEAKLIEDYAVSDINEAFKKLGKRFIGWNVYYLNINQEFHYVGKIVFARENNLDVPLIFDHDIAETVEYERSIKTSGKLSLKLDASNKNLKGALGGEIEHTIGKKESYTRVEKVEMKITVPAHKKLAVKVVGEARISNGVSQYRFFGIVFKKGTWEIMDVISEYYLYYEEDL
ncbi:MAG: hypothetical protein ACOX4W_01240 [Bacilli bacterium]